jgi:hypothetical protein
MDPIDITCDYDIIDEQPSMEMIYDDNKEQIDKIKSLNKLSCPPVVSSNKLKMEINDALIKLTVNIIPKNLSILSLTPLDGNCIFESLFALGYGTSANLLRNALSLIMYEFRDYKGFFPIHRDLTPTEIYNTFNTFPLSRVINNDKFMIVDYTYGNWCRDLSNSKSWNRADPDLLFLTVSRLFDIAIIVYDDESENETGKKYKAEDKKYKKHIRLGYIHKCHYVPLIKKKDNDKFNIPNYEIEKV